MAIRRVVIPALVARNREVIGGVSSFVTALTERLRQRDIEVQILGYGSSGDPEDDRFRPIVFGESPRGRDLSWALLRRRRQWSFPEGTVIHPQRPDQALAFLGERWPVVVSVHGCHRRTVDLRQGRMAGWVYQWIQRKVAREADAVVFETRQDREPFLERHPEAAERTHLVPIGVDRDRFRPGDRRAARRALGLPESGRGLVYLGRLEPEKNVGALIEAVGRVPGVELWIAGSGSQEQALRRAAGPGVRFLGFLPNEDVPRLVQAGDALVLASLHEGLATVVLQAWATGRPVIVPPVGDFPRLMQDQGGTVVPDRDPATFARAIADMMEILRQDPGRADTWESQLRGFSRAFDWDRITDQLVDVYESAADRHAGEAVG